MAALALGLGYFFWESAVDAGRAGRAAGVGPAVVRAAAGADPAAADLGLADLQGDELRRAVGTREPRGARRADPPPPHDPARHGRADRLPRRGAVGRLGFRRARDRVRAGAGAGRGVDLHARGRVLGAVVRALRARRAASAARRAG